jgi:hypothetical protein
MSTLTGDGPTADEARSAPRAGGFGASFELTLMTSDPELAAAGDEAGVDRIGVDIERLGKRSRQGHLPHLRISDHCLDQLHLLRPRLARSQLFVRCNPLHDETAEEIDVAVGAGVTVLMLPFFRSATEVDRFVRLVRARALVSLLVETPDAIMAIADIVRVSGVGEVMVGLNDLQHGYRLSNPFEFVVSDGMRRCADVVHDAGLRFGFGGLADPAHAGLPVPSSLVHAQYPRLRATSAFVARRFGPEGLTSSALRAGVPRCRAELDRWCERPLEDLEAARQTLEHVSAGWSDHARS